MKGLTDPQRVLAAISYLFPLFRALWGVDKPVERTFRAREADIIAKILSPPSRLFAGSSYFAGVMCGWILVEIIWILIPDNLMVLEANYYGLGSRISMETHLLEGRFDERVEYDFPLSLGSLYRKDDPELKHAFYEQKRYNEYVDKQGFLFWQTGLAYGFDPIGIDGYNGGAGFLNRVELFFTVGPMTIVESFITGLVTSFPILMLAQTIWLLIRKEQFWWD